MNSNDYIKKQLEELNINPINQPDKLSHLTADYIELRAFFSADIISLNDILTSYDKEDVKIKKIDESNVIGSTEAEENDETEIWIKEKFLICKNREELLSSDYPFILEDSSIKLKDNLTEKHKIYILLLLSSNLNYFPKFKTNLTTDFERISYEALKSYLPNNAITKQFGKNSDYMGTAKAKVINLASDLNVRYNDEMITENATGNQDRGLDIVAWIPFNDKIPNLLTILGQCACGKEWYKKNGETKHYEHYYRFNGHSPIHSMFIPYALVKTESSFFQGDEVDCLLFERFRIMECIGETTFINDLESKNIVEGCILYNN